MQKTLISIITLLLVLTACRDSDKSPHLIYSDPVLIGIIGPFSGQEAYIGKSCMQGIETTLQIAKEYGFTRPLTLITRDDQNDKEKSVAALRDLAAEGVSLIMALSDSDCVLALRDAANLYQIPILAVLASHPDASRGGLVNQLPFDDTQQATIAALYAMDERFLDEAAVIYDSSKTHFTSLAENFVRKYRSIGGTVRLYDLGKGKEISEHFVGQLHDTSVPFVYLLVGQQLFPSMVKMLKNLSSQPVIMGSDGAFAAISLNQKEELNLLEGVIFTDYFSADSTMTRFGKDVSKQFETIFDTPKTVMAGMGAEATMIAAQALHQCPGGPDSPACVQKKIRTTRDVQGICGKISINSNGKAERVLLVNEVRHGTQNFLLRVH